ncbi:MAG TPA: hypothetical protein VJH68_04155 [Candidatus Nanoarchaeia archaeon]|nr:hypothetical protein [Candidatus Nanoarchaeia archaeon]
MNLAGKVVFDPVVAGLLLDEAGNNGSVESAVAINLRSIFWCKITPARGMSLTGMVGYQP